MLNFIPTNALVKELINLYINSHKCNEKAVKKVLYKKKFKKNEILWAAKIGLSKIRNYENLFEHIEEIEEDNDKNYGEVKGYQILDIGVEEFIAHLTKQENNIVKYIYEAPKYKNTSVEIEKW